MFIDILFIAKSIINYIPEKVISRQPSTTEYLPGMLHTASPAALLPAFPSWSLLCLGASSLYSHSAGLPEHLQPGFLPHTNYLIPWDCAVRMDAWRARTRKTPTHNLTVKIFIGFEYECPRGHRYVVCFVTYLLNTYSALCVIPSVVRENGAPDATVSTYLFSPRPLSSTFSCFRGSHAFYVTLFQYLWYCLSPLTFSS